MQHSDHMDALAAALAKAQANIEGAVKDKVNPHLKSKYADLSSVWDACRESLKENGLSVVQGAEPSEVSTLALTTMLLHSSGQWVSGTMTMPLAKADPQGYGAALTYARRYGLAAMVGVCPEDDDAQSTVSHRDTYQERPQAQESRPQSSAPPLASGAALNNSNGQCPYCHCPSGKPHTKTCNRQAEE